MLAALCTQSKELKNLKVMLRTTFKFFSSLLSKIAVTKSRRLRELQKLF
ncbi:hypothetical protein APA_4783 [Pseudanabaena sp. lw0831]|nr:hypothetical protein APA_4783 [Pseudanabaena sp. lw0831]